MAIMELVEEGLSMPSLAIKCCNHQCYVSHPFTGWTSLVALSEFIPHRRNEHLITTKKQRFSLG
jgi:hypothetical protein